MHATSPVQQLRAPCAARRCRLPGARVSCVAAAAPLTGGNRAVHNGAHLTKERKAELEKVCAHIAQSGKGITACDEGPGTIGGACVHRAHRVLSPLAC
jgi:hypothetical protein